MKTIVITGSMRGLGLEMTKDFLQKNHKVVISGRNQSVVDEKVKELANEYPAENIIGTKCDVGHIDQVQALWKTAVDNFGKVDIWINNAGSSHDQVSSWEVPAEVAESIIQGNILGTIYGSQVAMRGMLAQGHGEIYNFSGYGSNGKTRFGTSIYATTKAATTYFTKSLADEAKDTGIIIGDLLPGIVLTDLVIKKIPPEQLEKVRPIFNIIGDLPENVAPWLTENILINKTNGARFIFMPRWKLLLRFLTSMFNKRDLFKDLGGN